MQETVHKTPVHLWIVGILALLWNAMGAFDYVATQMRLEFYLSQFSPEQMAYFTSFPAWFVAAWAIAVWSGLVGAVGLLLRKAWSVWLFGAAIVGMAVTTVYSFVLTDGAELMGAAATAFTAVIWVIALFLFFYARSQAKEGVLR